MKPVLTALASLIMYPCFSQLVVDVTKTDKLNESVLNTVSGSPFVNVKFVKLVKGSPYFQDEWLKGVLTTGPNSQARGDNLKLDLYDNKIHFLNDRGDELVATTPASELVLSSASGENYRFIQASKITGADKVSKNGWFQWLVTGPTSLYKYFDKKLTESTPYSSSTTEQTITTREKYYVTRGQNLVEIKKIKDAPEVFSDKKAEIENFLKTRDKKDDTMDNRLSDLVEYYNSIVLPLREL